MKKAGAFIIVISAFGCSSANQTPTQPPIFSEKPITLETLWSNALELYCKESPYAAGELAGVAEEIPHTFFRPEFCPLIRSTNMYQDVADLDSPDGYMLVEIDGLAVKHWKELYDSCFQRGWSLTVPECR